MNISQVRTGAIFAVLGLLAGCSGGGSPAAIGGKGGGSAGATGLGGAVGGTSGLGGTTGAAGAQGGTTGVGGTTAVGGAAGGSAGTGVANGGAGGVTAAGGKGGGAAGGTPGGGGTTAAGGKGGAGAGGTPGAGGAGNSNNKWGVIIVSQTAQTLSLPAPIGTTSIIASGGQATFGFSAGSDDNCPSTTSGDCQAFECAPKSTTTTSPPPTYLKAGDVSITGLLTTPLTLNWGGIPGTLTSYMSAALPSYLWTASRPATVTVTGSADVPAFTMGLTAPNPIAITNPVVSGVGVTGNTYTISKAGALNVTWTGGVEGMVSVDLTTGTAQSGQINIHCNVDASKGTVTVPANFMAKLGASGGFTAGVTSVADKNVGDWMMHFQASTVKDQGTATFTN